jgi:RNA polymerase sigma-70 factor, ECF subfamily
MYVQSRLEQTCSSPPWQHRRLEQGRMSAELEATHHAALIVAIAHRQDRAAFTALFTHFAPRLKTYLRHAGLNPAAAEEMSQDVLLAVWRKAGQYDPARATAAAWIFGIARNLRIDGARRGRVAVPEPDPCDDAPQADMLVAADETARRMRRAIDALPAEQVTMLQLAFFEDRSHAEIERLLGVPLGTIKSRLRLAISKLRATLKDDA